MGIVTTASLLCDNCGVTTSPLSSADGPMPPSWMKVQGYATVTDALSDRINGYFCPTCVGAVSVKDLIKKSADILVTE